MRQYINVNEDGMPLDENGQVIPFENGKPRLFDDTSVIEFDDVAEYNAYIGAQTGWNKDDYCNAVNEAHNALFRSLYQSRNYLSIGEMPLWFDDEEFGAEALALAAWWKTTCKQVALYLANVTEDTAIPVAQYIAGLPQF